MFRTAISLILTLRRFGRSCEGLPIREKLAVLCHFGNKLFSPSLRKVNIPLGLRIVGISGAFLTQNETVETRFRTFLTSAECRIVLASSIVPDLISDCVTAIRPNLPQCESKVLGQIIRASRRNRDNLSHPTVFGFRSRKERPETARLLDPLCGVAHNHELKVNKSR